MYLVDCSVALPSGTAVKNPPALQEPQETRVRSLGQEDPLEEGMAIHSRILVWRISMGRGACQATKVTKSRAWLKWLILHNHMHTDGVHCMC